MPNYFTPKDFAKLQEKIRKTEAKLDEAKLQIGEACNQGSDTFHDNFPYEEALRQVAFWSRRLQEFIDLQCDAQIVYPSEETIRVAISTIVTIEDVATHEEETYRIASFGIAIYSDEKGVVSYNSPLGQCLLGAWKGDIRTLRLGEKIRQLRVKKIQSGA